MAGGGPTGRGLNSDINVTPLVDVVLVMLIIFMVIAPLMSRSLKVKVPRKAEAQEQDQQLEEQLVVRLSGEGEEMAPSMSRGLKLSLNNHVLELAELDERLRAILRGRPADERVVFFDADGDTNYGHCVTVMDVIKGSGARALGIMTPKEGEEGEGEGGEAETGASPGTP